MLVTLHRKSVERSHSTHLAVAVVARRSSKGSLSLSSHGTSTYQCDTSFKTRPKVLALAAFVKNLYCSSLSYAKSSYIQVFC